jgi:hypothetical protein
VAEVHGAGESARECVDGIRGESRQRACTQEGRKGVTLVMSKPNSRHMSQSADFFLAP